ncbi:MAG: ATP-dependent helicase [Bacteroidales bacterium]|nr:ATP-dependent helicase [Bacteroidales bacterium]
MKILLAGPGTGKTTKVKTIIDNDFKDLKVQVISFTNATIDDLTKSFKKYKKVNCATLHSFALRLNHLPNVQILHDEEIKILEKISKKVNIDFDTLCKLFDCITFDKMISSCESFIRNNPAYAEDKIGRLDLLIVDEFQDFNPSEQSLIYSISNFATETIILGDDDQSIYSFKDADPEGIINLYNRKDIEKIPHDNICHRCPDSIVDACMNLIKHNKKRVDKVWGKSNRTGNLNIFQTKNQQDTNETILKRINQIRQTDTTGSILILSPVGFAAKPLIPMLLNNGYEPNDCLNKKIDIDELKPIWIMRSIFTDNQILNLIFYSYSINLFSKPKFIKGVKEHLDKNSKSAEFKEYLITNLNFNNDFKKYILSPPDLDELRDKYPEYSKIIEHLDPIDIKKSLNNIFQLMNPQVDFKKGGVNIMSIHKSKGLESEYVFIVGLVSGILPNENYGLDSIEAQRRLLFVGMSRTLKELNIVSNTYWKAEYIHKVDKKQFKYAHWIRGSVKKYAGQISSFINELKN